MDPAAGCRFDDHRIISRVGREAQWQHAAKNNIQHAVQYGLGAFAMLPLAAFLIVPLGKLAEWIGLVDRTTISSATASTLLTSGMLVMWLIVGDVFGIMLSLVTIKRTRQVEIQRQASEHGL